MGLKGKILSVSDWAAKNQDIGKTGFEHKRHQIDDVQCIQPIKSRITYNIIMYELFGDEIDE
jgi:hypothetical protein